VDLAASPAGRRHAVFAVARKDIRTGQHLCNLPDGLVQAMQAAAKLPVDLDADIEGDVAL